MGAHNHEIVYSPVMYRYFYMYLKLKSITKLKAVTRNW